MAAEDDRDECPTTPSEPVDVELAAPPCAAPRELVALPSGRRVEVRRSPGELLVVYGPSGTLEVEIRFTPQGPQLVLAGASIHLQSAGVVSVACERFEVHARGDVEITADGALRQTAGGDASTTAGGAATTVARELDLRATAGDAAIESTGDLWIDGRNVLINS